MTNLVPLAQSALSLPTTKRREVVYLACPYTDDDPSVRQARFEAATDAAASIIRQGKIVYSPITMTHPIDIVLAGSGNTLGSDYWVAFDEAFMDMCSTIVVLQLEGWDKSRGVSREIEYFKSRDRDVAYLKP